LEKNCDVRLHIWNKSEQIWNFEFRNS